MSLETLIDDFSLFDDWEDRYRYIIELGQKLEPLEEAEQADLNKVPGCASQVWLVTDNLKPNMKFRGNSDAHIVRGLIAILFELYNDKTAADIMQVDPRAAFQALGLSEHLTPQRSNGFNAMVQRIRKDAEAALAN